MRASVANSRFIDSDLLPALHRRAGQVRRPDTPSGRSRKKLSDFSSLVMSVRCLPLSRLMGRHENIKRWNRVPLHWANSNGWVNRGKSIQIEPYLDILCRALETHGSGSYNTQISLGPLYAQFIPS